MTVHRRGPIPLGALSYPGPYVPCGHNGGRLDARGPIIASFRGSFHWMEPRLSVVLRLAVGERNAGWRRLCLGRAVLCGRLQILADDQLRGWRVGYVRF